MLNTSTWKGLGTDLLKFPVIFVKVFFLSLFTIFDSVVWLQTVMHRGRPLQCLFSMLPRSQNCFKNLGMVEEFKCRLSATFSYFNPLSVCEIMLLFSSRVSSLPILPMLVVDINDIKIAEVTTTSGLQRINIVYGGSLVTKMKNCEYHIIDDKHLLIFIRRPS